MTVFSVGQDMAGIRDGLTRMAAVGRNPHRLLEAIGLGLETSTRERMRDGVDPDGVKWESYAPLNPLYEQGKKGSGILLGPDLHLYNSIRSGVDGNAVVVGTDVKYGRVHQYGAIIQPKKELQLSFMMGGVLVHASSVHIPARPYLGFSGEDREMVVGQLEDVYRSAIRR
ncbi:phage virion morphogenesis protein [Komagataeibacter medellinensis]|uniref:Phage virion morphogenesis protein n=1 Tax=Komagataeibacter medellinensis TaxID=1177712 RepID=A0ABQ6VUX0_9PROT|nr:phage virion morphogenesis protein [Komagataeibacter medellinensis]KAB8123995.1 phage virion morphogenesis protein [Komagataeibacter medellinensis]